MKATRLVHELCGAPEPEGPALKLLDTVSARCCMCGRIEPRTAVADKALGTNFVDRTLFTAPSEARVCAGCLVVCSGKPPRTFRMWTVVATPGLDLPASQEKAAQWIGQHAGVCLTSRANTRPVIDVLLDPPASEWVVSIAVSGQKHVLPYADVNTGARGVIRFESVSVPVDVRDWRHVFFAALGLRRMGIPVESIIAGTPKNLRTVADLERWRELDARLEGWRDSQLLAVALWSITKGIIDDLGNYPDA